MNDHLLQPSLGGCSLHNPLVNGVSCDKSVHHHWLSLTNAMTAILGLKVTLGILMGVNVCVWGGGGEGEERGREKDRNIT